MKKIFLGIILGFILGTAVTVTYAAMSGSRQGREVEKFIEDSAGKTCVMVTISE